MCGIVIRAVWVKKTSLSTLSPRDFGINTKTLSLFGLFYCCQQRADSASRPFRPHISESQTPSGIGDIQLPQSAHWCILHLSYQARLSVWTIMKHAASTTSLEQSRLGVIVHTVWTRSGIRCGIPIVMLLCCALLPWYNNFHMSCGAVNWQASRKSKCEPST